MTDWFRTDAGHRVPAVTADGMRAVDRATIEDAALPLLSMMENAGRTLASVVRSVDDGPVTVVAGGGGNGGGGLCAARHLHNHGAPVRVVLDRDPADVHGAAGTQLGVLRYAGVEPVVEGPASRAAIVDAAIVIDALIGYGLSGAPRGRVAALVETIRSDADRVLSLDVPTGLDATTGETPGLAVEPDRTLTLALPKTGLGGLPGPLWLGDIGIPPSVYDRLGIDYDVSFDGRYRVPIEPVDG